MRTGAHWDDYPPDDPPQCTHPPEGCECSPPDEVGDTTHSEPNDQQ